MTSAKEKAKELVDKMLYCYQGNIDEYTAKQCAKLAVDEILDIVKDIYCYDKDILAPYWQEVKQEIEKL